MSRLMALDVGEVRIGIALSDTSGLLASPCTTLRVSRDETETWRAIQRVIEEYEVERLVVGLPVSLDGKIHKQGERIIAFTERLKTFISLPVTFWDERLSTVEAERLLHEREQRSGKRRPRQPGGHRRKKRGEQEIDALAAAVILQEYLDQRVQEKNTALDIAESEEE